MNQHASISNSLYLLYHMAKVYDENHMIFNRNINYSWIYRSCEVVKAPEFDYCLSREWIQNNLEIRYLPALQICHIVITLIPMSNNFIIFFSNFLYIKLTKILSLLPLLYLIYIFFFQDKEWLSCVCTNKLYF